ncbi:Flp family type IVb pilin [Pseudomonas sp. TE3610]
MSLNKAKQAITRFLKRTDGASGIEYAIIATMVAVALVAFSGPIAAKVTVMFTSIRDAL